MTSLLLFVGLLILAFLLGAIRYWHDMRLHDKAWSIAQFHQNYLEIDHIAQTSGRVSRGPDSFPTGKMEMQPPEWQEIPRRKKDVELNQNIQQVAFEHPDLISANLSDIERQIIANALRRPGEDLPGVGPSFAE